MTYDWDELSKSLVEPVPRRESLRRLGVVLTGAVLSPLGLDTALAGRPDPCKAFCKCRNKTQQDQCLNACRACNKDTRRLCGGCGSYVCCGSGRACCNGYCTDLADDVLNCGACAFVCDEPGPYGYGACIDGRCEYACAEGAVDCHGICTFLGADLYNCGACGVACAYGEVCSEGACVPVTCGGGAVYCPVVYPGGGPGCTFLEYDSYNCGACGRYCSICVDGECYAGEPPDPGGWV